MPCDELLITHPNGRARHEASTLSAGAMGFVPDDEAFQLVLLPKQDWRDVQAVGHTPFLGFEAHPAQQGGMKIVRDHHGVAGCAGRDVLGPPCDQWHSVSTFVRTALASPQRGVSVCRPPGIPRDRTVVAGEDDQGVVGNTKRVQSFQEHAHRRVHRSHQTDVACFHWGQTFGLIDPAWIGHDWRVDGVGRKVEEERLTRSHGSFHAA